MYTMISAPLTIPDDVAEIVRREISATPSEAHAVLRQALDTARYRRRDPSAPFTIVTGHSALRALLDVTRDLSEHTGLTPAAQRGAKTTTDRIGQALTMIESAAQARAEIEIRASGRRRVADTQTPSPRPDAVARVRDWLDTTIADTLSVPLVDRTTAVLRMADLWACCFGTATDDQRSDTLDYITTVIDYGQDTRDPREVYPGIRTADLITLTQRPAPDETGIRPDKTQREHGGVTIGDVVRTATGDHLVRHVGQDEYGRLLLTVRSEDGELRTISNYARPLFRQD